MAVEVITTSGSWPWPAGVTSAIVECIGGGAGGVNGTAAQGRSGNGGGAYSRDVVSKTAATADLVVGAAGTTGATATAGGDTTFSQGGTTNVKAVGGAISATPGTVGGLGGAAASCIGSVKQSGGNGGTRVTTTGGGGGGSGGAGGDGGNASGATAGAAGAASGVWRGGAVGGAGGIANNPGTAASAPGGGGSGGGSGSQAGGAAQPGQIIITYNRHWVGGTGNMDATAANWAAEPGGTGGYPIPTSADNAIFDTASGAVNVTTAAGNTGCKNCDMTTFPGTLTTSASLDIAGDLTVGANATFAGNGAVNYSGNVTYIAGAQCTKTGQMNYVGSGSSVFTTNGVQIKHEFNINGTGTLTMADDIVAATTVPVLHHLAGNLNLNNHNLSLGGFSFGGGTGNLSMGSGTLTSTAGLGVTGWNRAASDTITITPGTSVVKLVINTGARKYFVGGNQTYYDLLLSGTSTGVFEIQDDNTFHKIYCDTPPDTIEFEDGTTQTVAELGLSGTAGNLVTLTSVSGGTWAIAKAGGGDLSIDYVNISNCDPPVGTTLYVGTHSTDGGNNGPRVVFSDPPSGLALTSRTGRITDTALRGRLTARRN